MVPVQVPVMFGVAGVVGVADGTDAVLAGETAVHPLRSTARHRIMGINKLFIGRRGSPVNYLNPSCFSRALSHA